MTHTVVLIHRLDMSVVTGCFHSIPDAWDQKRNYAINGVQWECRDRQAAWLAEASDGCRSSTCAAFEAYEALVSLSYRSIFVTPQPSL